MNPDLLNILCCPETRQPLKPASAALMERLNQKIAARELRNRAGHVLGTRIDAGLIRADEKLLFPVRNGLPILLMDEAIDITPFHLS